MNSRVKYITHPMSDKGRFVINGLTIIKRVVTKGVYNDTNICIIEEPSLVAYHYSSLIIGKDIFEIPSNIVLRFTVKSEFLTNKTFCNIWNEIYKVDMSNMSNISIYSSAISMQLERIYKDEQRDIKTWYSDGYYVLSYDRDNDNYKKTNVMLV